MELDLSVNLLFVLVPIVVVLALAASLHYLLLLDLILVIFSGEWRISGVHVDVADLIIAGVGLGLLVQPAMRRKALRWRTSASKFWLFLGAAASFVCLVLLVVGLLLKMFPGDWELFGRDFDFGQLMGIGVASWVFIEGLRWDIPYTKLWLLLGLLVSLAYVYAPINSAQLTGPAAIAYQLYRYCWRPILFYPLAFILLDDRTKRNQAIVVIVVCGAMCSLLAFSQGWAGVEVTGPFRTKNHLGGALIIPCLLSLSELLRTGSKRRWWVSAVSFILIVRGLLFSGSRGAIVAVLAGTAFMLCWVLMTAEGRSRALRIAGAGILLAIFVLVLKPDITERPNIRHLLTTSEGTESETMKWRMEERWPYFLEQAVNNFWLGTGTDVDPDLGEDAATPHNGYLGVAVVSGVPSLSVLVLLALLGVVNGVRVWRRSRDRADRITGIAIAAAIVGLLIHNLVDEMFRLPFAMDVFWMIAAAAIALAKLSEPVAQTASSPNNLPSQRGLSVRFSTIGARP